VLNLTEELSRGEGLLKLMSEKKCEDEVRVRVRVRFRGLGLGF